MRKTSGERGPRKRPKAGDVLEVQTPTGRGYVQFVARDSTLGPQVRVLRGVFESRPDILAVAATKAEYYVHFPVGPAVSRGLVTIVGHAPLPSPSGGKRPEDDLYRLMEIWTDVTLAAKLSRGWHPTGTPGK